MLSKDYTTELLGLKGAIKLSIEFLYMSLMQ